MPASTATHDVQLEVFNDTAFPVSVRVLREVVPRQQLAGPPAHIYAGESLPLVLVSGTWRVVKLLARIRCWTRLTRC